MDLEGLLPWADDRVCPCTLTLICFSPWQVGQIETNAPSPMQTSYLRGFHLDAAPGSPRSVLVRVMYRVRAWEASCGDSVWGTHRVFPKHWMTSGEKGQVGPGLRESQSKSTRLPPCPPPSMVIEGETTPTRAEGWSRGPWWERRYRKQDPGPHLHHSLLLLLGEAETRCAAPMGIWRLENPGVSVLDSMPLSLLAGRVGLQ